MANNKLEIACQKCNELKKKLMGYQNASVDMICKKFSKGADRILLADEVGLGKTIIAQGVIANMAKAHWENNNDQDRPFHVAYICPNRNVAEQNFPKLQIFPVTPELLNKEVADKIKEALQNYHKTNDCGANQQAFLKESSVYTRAWDWLAEIFNGKSLEDAMGSDLVRIYLNPENENIYSSEWSINKYIRTNSDNRFGKVRLISKKIIHAVKFLKKNCIEVLEKNGYQDLVNFLSTAWDETGKFRSKCNKCSECDEICPHHCYYFNKRVALYLSGIDNNRAALYLPGREIVEDYRLSMQHLYSAEAKYRGIGKIMQLECLTPQTSLKIGVSYGTFSERALLAATLDFAANTKFNFAETEHPMLGNAEPSNFQSAYEAYYGRLSRLPKDDFEEMVPQNYRGELSFKIKPEEVCTLRKAFIENNIERLNYDLIIMDEFQNYSELLNYKEDNNDDKGKNDRRDREINEAIGLAQKLFEKEGCKILMLSATPFKITDYVPDEFNDDEEESGSDTRAVQSDVDDFFKLVEFLLPTERYPAWKNDWDKASDNKKKETLLLEAGILRTEHIAAAKHNPVYEYPSERIIPDFEYALRANRAMADASAYRNGYGRTTPYALSFATSYNLYGNEVCAEVQDERVSRKDESLFLSERQLEGCEEIMSGNNAFEELKSDIFSKKQTGGVRYDRTLFSPASMLWIPPSEAEKLSGAFEGRRGFSKTLIFSNYRMTPMAFTYLLCHKAKVDLPKMEKQVALSEEDVKEKIKQFNEEKVNEQIDKEKYPKTAAEFQEFFTNLFCSEYGIAAIRSVYPNNDYLQAVKKYCNDGCFDEMLREYFSLLKNEYNGSDWRIASTISKISRLKIPALKLYLKLNETNEVGVKYLKAANHFAVGLFSEESNGDTERRLANIKAAFNSPFWPFVFISTSIGTEGIDLHWYARNIIHWSVPSRPIDLEQRGGRVLRYNCHAFRLNKALNPVKSEAMESDWTDSGLFESQLNFFKDEEFDGKNGCFHVTRKVYFDVFSPEEKKYAKAKKIVSRYRLMIGKDNQAIKDFFENPDKVQADIKPICLAPWKHRKET